MSNKSITQVLVCVKMTDLVPKQWERWFYHQFASNAPFSWGDNNHTLVTMARFTQHAQDVYELNGPRDYPVNRGAWKNFLLKLDRWARYDHVFVDLEN